MKLAAIFLVILVAGCAAPVRTDLKAVDIQAPLKGVSISPKSSSPADFVSFIQKASAAGTAITWAGTMDKFGDAETIAQLAKTYGFTPIFITQLPDTALNNTIVKEQYRKQILGFIGKYRPKYFGLGNEINNLKNLDAHLEFYGELYDDIKLASPETSVFTVFQLEKMKTENQWALLSKANKFDVIAFTTYPGTIYNKPADIPDDYYTDIKTKIFRPIAFSEIGWPRSNPEDQADFIRRFALLTTEVRSSFNIWPFLYDQPVAAPFNTMGLLNDSETPAWRVWQNTTF